MKVYLFYLKISEKDKRNQYNYKSKYDISYFVTTLNQYKTSRYSEENDMWYILYGFTDKKDIAEQFMLTRDMDKFILKEKKVSEKEYKIFKTDNIDSHLSIRKLHGIDDNEEEYDDRHSVLCNKNEFVNMLDARCEIDMMMTDAAKLPYDMFNRKYIAALDILLYTNFNVLNEEDGADMVGSAASYSKTYEGYGCPHYKYNMLSAFIRMFRYTMKL